MGKFSVRTAAAFSATVFFIVFITVSITGTITFALFHFGILNMDNRGFVILVPVFTSMVLGTLFSLSFGRKPIQMIEGFCTAFQQIAKGHFDVKIDENIPVVELREIAKNFNIMVRELAGTEILRSDFVENVSHEFKTPLTAIEGYATLLQQPNLSEEKRLEYTKKILHSTRRLNSLTGNILLLSRLENQELEIQKEIYSLDEQLRECLLLLEPDWTAKELELDIQLDDCICTANPALMAHVWQNIFGNAIKFSPIGGTVCIRLERHDTEISVSITDQGPGMTEDVKKRIFEKFYQGDASRSTKGNGLGMTLVKRIIDLHGGTVTVESQPNQGSTFRVTLPAVPW